MTADKSLPKGWIQASLADVGILHCGQSPSVSDVNHEGNGTPYVTGPDQWDGVTLTVDKWTTNPKRIVPDGCIFITVKGAGVGTLFAGVACAIGRDVYAFEPVKTISRSFIEHSLRFNILEVLRHAKGDIPGLSKSHILDHVTKFPPLNEQRRIVSKIEELFSDLDAGVAALKRAKANLKRYRAAVLKAAVEGKLTEEWRAKHPHAEPASKLLARILTERRQKWESDQLAKFAAAGKEPPKGWKEKYVDPTPPDLTDESSIPDGWSWANVETICSDIVDCPHSTPAWTIDGKICVRTTEFRPGQLDLTDVRFVSEATFHERIARLKPQPGDVIYSREGAILGIACIIPDGVELCLGQRMMLMRALCSGQFLMHVLNAPVTLSQVRKLAGGSASPHLNVADIKQFLIPLPPLAEQSEIAYEVELRFSVITAAGREIEHALVRAARLRQSILKQAFEGKLVPQDPDDEPANELLTRLNDCQLSRKAIGDVAVTTKRGGRKSASSKKNNDEVGT